MSVYFIDEIEYVVVFVFVCERVGDFWDVGVVEVVFEMSFLEFLFVVEDLFRIVIFVVFLFVGDVECLFVVFIVVGEGDFEFGLVDWGFEVMYFWLLVELI